MRGDNPSGRETLEALEMNNEKVGMLDIEHVAQEKRSLALSGSDEVRMSGTTLSCSG